MCRQRSLLEISNKIIILILSIFAGLFAAGQTCDMREFQFPCYRDNCTFPTQFCNTERYIRQCSPCDAVCQDKKVPTECKCICELNDVKKKTTNIPQLTHKTTKVRQLTHKTTKVTQPTHKTTKVPKPKHKTTKVPKPTPLPLCEDHDFSSSTQSVNSRETCNIPECHFTCYQDTCTFPTQFCNTESYIRQCIPCDAVCQDEKVPEECKCICGLNGENKTAKAALPTQLPLNEDNGPSSPIQGWQIPLLIVGIAVVVVAVAVGVIRFIRRPASTGNNETLADQAQQLLLDQSQSGVNIINKDEVRVHLYLNGDHIDAEDGGKN